MEQEAESVFYAMRLIFKGVILSARWVAVMRLRGLAKNGDTDADRHRRERFLRDELGRCHDLIGILRNQLAARKERRHLTIKERLAVLWHMEYFRIPKRRASQYFGIARSTLARWLDDVVGKDRTAIEPRNKTPADVVRLVWEIARSMPLFGKLRISQQLALLSIFVSASTVRNILSRPEPPRPKTARTPEKKESPPAGGTGIEAEHPNHVWSADLTTVKLWAIWSVHMFVVIDHFSRKLITAVPFKSPNAKPVVSALETAIQSFGRPTHLITDQGSVFTSTQFEEFLMKQDIDHVLGAIGEHGSVAKTERVIGTLKREWLRRLSLIRGMDHLAELCKSAVCWYNDFRPHQALAGNLPNDVYRSGRVIPFAPTDRSKFKSVPLDIERTHVAEPRTTSWRLTRCA